MFLKKSENSRKINFVGFESLKTIMPKANLPFTRPSSKKSKDAKGNNKSDCESTIRSS